MPDRMPEDMSDRMPEDLPVRKSINVMVGITRSKVIFWNFRHRLVRHYWYPTIIYQTLDGHVGTLSCCCKRRYILTRKNMFASHPRLAVISQYISIRQPIQRPLYIWLPTIPHEISTLFHLILAILLGVFTCVFFACIILAMCPTCPHFRTKKKHAKLLFRLLFSLPC